MEKKFEEFTKTYEQKVIPLSKELNLASYNASISGKSEDYQKAANLQIELSKIYSNKDDFAKLVEFKNSNEIRDELLKRQLIIIYNEYASYQLDEKLLEEIIKLSNEIEEKFNTFRAEINNKKVTDNEIEEILQTSTDSKEVETAWNASKEVGTLVERDVKKLVKMRNDAAKKLGYKNYHEMSLSLSEQNSEEIDKLFTELDELTKNEYIKLKDEIDQYLTKKFNIQKEELMPWHYQDRFFQEGPAIYNVDLDDYYKDKDIAKIIEEYYNGIGLPIYDLLEKSDLYEKEGKYQHAF
ncbi:MAG: M2 family metallopeptidase, partial [Ignavibacteriales bacterium]|nr:M2 family metallopeptidase [Ignavibacteriales bacterium]